MQYAVVRSLLFSITFFLCATLGAQSNTNLYEAIRNNANTSKFADWIDDSEMKEVFVKEACNGIRGCLTVFIPNNLAVEAITSTLNWQSLPLTKKKYIVSGHIFDGSKSLTAAEWAQTGTSMDLRDVGFGTGRKTTFQMYNIRYAFETEVNKTTQYYVNQARLIPPEIQTSNGVIHIIDTVLNTPSSITPFLNYLMEQDDLKTSAELWFQLQNDPRYAPFLNQQYRQKEQYATYLLATDAAWSKVPSIQLQNLKANTTLLAEVLSYGYLPNQLVYSKWTDVMPKIQLQSGFPAENFASGSNQLRSAMLLRSADDGLTYQTNDGYSTQLTSVGEDIWLAVVHKTNSVLGFVWETREQLLRGISETFLQECRADSICNGLLMSDSQLTFLVPNDSGMARFSSLPTTLKATYLKYMVLNGRITAEQMNPMYAIEVDGLPGAIRFRIEPQDLFVEARLPKAGYVATRILQINRLAVNGVVHLVDGVPGLPLQTVEQYVASTPEYSKFSAYRSAEASLPGGPYLYLVPTNQAMEVMEMDTDVGAVLLGNAVRRAYIFRRHSLPITALFEDLAPGKYKAPTANYAFTGEEIDLDLKAVNSYQRVTTIKFHDQSTVVTTTEGAYQFTDGVVYRLNKILYVSSDLTSDLCTNPACP
ncbi:unnamed protein product [Dicrocoelium dendriticum]|nr:unnamed protein product [Dicrocoelium dendriticum]